MLVNKRIKIVANDIIMTENTSGIKVHEKKPEKFLVPVPFLTYLMPSHNKTLYIISYSMEPIFIQSTKSLN